jgi:hydrogenase maturation protease
VAARIVGLGQEWAGDDGAGLAVVRSLRTAPSLLPHSAAQEPFQSPSPTFSCGRGQSEGSDTLQAPIPASRRNLSESWSTAIDLVEAADPTELVSLLTDGADPVVIVDAVLDEGPAGRVLLIDPQNDSISTHLLSTHGLGVLETIELARIAYPKAIAERIFIVGITIQLATPGAPGLSQAVTAGVPIAAVQALKLAGKE